MIIRGVVINGPSGLGVAPRKDALRDKLALTLRVLVVLYTGNRTPSESHRPTPTPRASEVESLEQK